MNFFLNQAKSHRRTKTLLAYFFTGVLLTVFSVYFGVKLIIFFVYLKTKSDLAGFRWWDAALFWKISACSVTLVGLGSLYKISILRSGGKPVAESLGGRLIRRDTTDLKEKRVLNIVEEMAIASGMAVPQVYVLDGEKGINAFAAGWSPGSAVIGVTRGSLDLFSREELQGVVAHEFSHILNGDMRLNIQMMGIVYGLVCMAVLGRILFSTGGRRNPLVPLGILLAITGFLGVVFGKLIQAAISREREYLADASGVQCTRNPLGIAAALKKIGGLSYGSDLAHPRAQEASHFFFAKGLSSWFGLFHTHPPLLERIRLLDPAFEGVFPEVAYQEESERQHLSLVQAKGLGGAAFALAPDEALAQVGNAAPEHLDYAQNLLSGWPEKIKAALASPEGAQALVCLLLLARDPDAARGQLALLDAIAGPELKARIAALRPSVAALGLEHRLPLVDMAIPVLKNLSKAEYAAFRDRVRRLTTADNQVDLFEFVLEQVLLRHLDPYFQFSRPHNVRYKKAESVAGPVGDLLSCLAHCSADSPEAARAAFEEGRLLLGKNIALTFLAKEAVGLAALSKALDPLASSAPFLKRDILKACAATVAADGKVTLDESELLRAVADVLDCPMPPFVAISRP